VKIKRRSNSPLKKKASHGFRGYPIATVAFYGPDDTRASKAVVTIINSEHEEDPLMERWFLDDADVRSDPDVGAQILRVIQTHGAKSISTMDRIIGCPHQEGIDYPDGEVCPKCAFWANRDRWTGELLQ
jgi:hypothetical protein